MKTMDEVIAAFKSVASTLENTYGVAMDYSETMDVEDTRIHPKNCKKCANRRGCGDKKTTGYECTRYIPEKKIKRR